MESNTYLQVDFIEKEIINVELIEKELITVDLYVVDILKDRGYILQTIKQYYINNERPTRISATTYETEHTFVAGTLRVTLNGLKEFYITEIGDNRFKFDINTLVGDIVEVSYIRLSQ